MCAMRLEGDEPKPEWQPGDIVTAADGVVYMRTHSGRFWFAFGVGESFYDDVPKRPLTLLVRDGRAVAA